jgi:16S rRNA (guanine(1405)-N(7))-methyltransferase
MQGKQVAEDLVNKVLQSKKYKSLYHPTIERIVKDTLSRYPKNQVEKAVKRKLHQLWGAYSVKLNYQKLLSQLKSVLEDNGDIKTTLLPLLKLQTSTNERIPILDDFYSKIFAITGNPQTIFEPACGFNALTYFWMPPHTRYTGFDVDREQVDFINSVFNLTGVSQFAHMELGDIIIDKFINSANVALLLKTLPLLEHQQPGCSIEVLDKLRSKHIVVSYPTHSISGKNKGMVDFYTQQFTNLVSTQPWKIHQLSFDTELVFIIQK